MIIVSYCNSIYFLHQKSYHLHICSQRWGTKHDISLYKRCSFKTMTCTITCMSFYMKILCAFRKLLKSADTLFCGAFWKYLQKYVLDVTGHRCPMLHPQQLFLRYTYTSTSMIPAIAKTYMVAVHICYVDGSMRQNFE